MRNNTKKNKQNNSSKHSFNRQPRTSGRKKSTLNPQLLVKKATTTNYKEYVSDRKIIDLPINKKLIDCLTEKGFYRPTEIQDRSIETLLEKRDLLGIAQTGTGKTGAFLVPIIHQLLEQNQQNFALVVVPTRELAIQVEDEFKSMSKGLGLHCACFIGGTNINSDEVALRRKNNVIIGTPGRLLDLMGRKLLKLGAFKTLVLDEYDRMLDMGFLKDVNRILDAMPKTKQTLLFSATLNKTQQPLIDSILKNPVTIKVSSGLSSTESVNQDIIKVAEGQDKFTLLCNLLNDKSFDKVLVFEETKHKVKRLSKKLNNSGILANDIHGDKSQNARQKALNSFKKGEIHVLVATDVAARGIDVSDVTHVINYDIPQTYETYIHRIGRTGRAGKTGQAFTFV